MDKARQKSDSGYNANKNILIPTTHPRHEIVAMSCDPIPVLQKESKTYWRAVWKYLEDKNKNNTLGAGDVCSELPPPLKK